MDEVDKIIIHSLRNIGCQIKDDIFSLANFTPELLVHTVTACLLEIKPTATLPKTLPEGMTQRFGVASTLAEACAAVGYRSDIGYQTFLYPNVVDARKLFMFLIEKLPKDRIEAPQTDATAEEGSELAVLEREIKRNILQSLHTPWVPSYCRQRTSSHNTHTIVQYVDFKPHLNLNIPSVRMESADNPQLQYLAPNIFQQMSAADFDIISSVLHKHDMAAYQPDDVQEQYAFIKTAAAFENGVLPVISTSSFVINDVAKINDICKSPMEVIGNQVNALKNEHNALNATRKTHNLKINELKVLQSNVQQRIAEQSKSIKMHERTHVVLEQPEQNVEKLEGIISATQEKRKTLENQWHSYREPLEQRLRELQSDKPKNSAKNALDLRELIVQLESSMQEKTTKHAQLSAELKRPNRAVAASRKEYTRRIMEFIGNIRKQRNDIFKVLDDTRDLQKQINTVSAQLQRQFNYTDDLLFKSAKHDAHSRRAYKLLAALHAACNELVELVSQTGNVTKEIRDLEVHIDREKIKNIAVNMEKISLDIKNFEDVVKSIQAKIHEVENRITEG